MRIIHIKEMNTVDLNVDVKKYAKAFFEYSKEILYVVDDRKLIGIITETDFYRNADTGEIINKNFKFLEKQCEEYKMYEEADNFFERNKNISEVPIIDRNRNLLFALRREGNPLDVFPSRFQLLYGRNKQLAEFIFNKRIKTISLNNPKILDCYLKEFLPEFECEFNNNLKTVIDAETLCVEYELEMFKKKVEKSKRVYFFKLPYAQEMKYLSKEERSRADNGNKKNMQYYLKNYFQSAEATCLIQRVLGDKVNEEFISNHMTMPQYYIKSGICYNIDEQKIDMNVVNGRRITTDGMNTDDGSIYLFGPCTVFGPLVDDSHTISSCLQRKINLYNIQRSVINEGMPGIPLIEEIRKFNRTSYMLRDVFIFFLREGYEENLIRKVFGEVEIYSISMEFERKKIHDYFLDVPVHCNDKANEVIADYLYTIISEVLLGNKNQEGVLNAEINDLNDVWQEELREYQCFLKEYYKQGHNGAIVMNCNPFTNGHLYLIEYAAQQVDYLYIFVVSEDKSCFPFEDRMKLIREGIPKCLENVIVIPSGTVVLSSNTFPEYFYKENLQDAHIDTSFDLEIFSQHIAPELSIKVRFVGEEPTDAVTRQYNRDMKKILPRYGMEVICVPRKCIGDEEYISASVVRRLWKEKNWEEIKKRVPDSTFQYLLKHEHESSE